MKFVLKGVEAEVEVEVEGCCLRKEVKVEVEG